MQTAEQTVSHTPGPWTVEPSDSGDPSVGQAPTPPVVFADIPNDDRFRSIEIAVIGSTIYGNSEDGYDLSYGDPDANASLIGAAPELLAACRLMLWVIEQNNLDPVDGNMWSIRERAEQAIAKAEGR